MFNDKFGWVKLSWASGQWCVPGMFLGLGGWLFRIVLVQLIRQHKLQGRRLLIGKGFQGSPRSSSSNGSMDFVLPKGLNNQLGTHLALRRRNSMSAQQVHREALHINGTQSPTPWFRQRNYIMTCCSKAFFEVTVHITKGIFSLWQIFTQKAVRQESNGSSSAKPSTERSACAGQAEQGGD